MINITINTATTTNLSLSGFYSAAFIARATTQERHVVITSLQDCIDAGYDETTEAYEWAKVALGQSPRMPTLYIRAMYSGETPTQALQALPLDCLYLCLEDIDLQTKVDLATTVNAGKYLYVVGSDVDITSSFTNNPNVIYIHKATYDITHMQDDSGEQYDYAFDNETTPTAQYPEAAWVSRFGSQQPASVAWLHKPLTSVVKPPSIAPIQASYYGTMYDSDVVLGSSKTMNDEWIDQAVFIKWLEMTLQRQVFGLLIENAKVAFTTAGRELLLNRVRSVLSVGVKLGGLTDKYEAYIISEQREQRNIVIGFKAQLLNALNSVEDIQGTITA